ncbi:MAG: LOG family protein [Chloroflexi bacterium]|nr:LOG family protein [Chloroflexota bacterium]
MRKVISVYGSALTAREHPDYAAGVAVGHALAQAGFSVMTGGYDGLMGAISQGANEAGGHVIGITSATIEKIRPAKANMWVREVIHYMTLHERLLHLITRADGYVAMPGGLGTLNELVMVWELMRVNEIPHNPIVCYGDYWREILTPFYGARYMPANAPTLHFAHTPQEVVAVLQGGG